MKVGKYSHEPFMPLEKALTKFRTIKELTEELKKIDEEFENEVLVHIDDEEFNWGGHKTPFWRTLTIAQEMERLCHGQLICYFALADFKLPPNFKKSWGSGYLE